MTALHPLMFRWEGDGFVPANQYVAKRADQLYVVGELYRIAEYSDRSPESHRHYFAMIREAWQNLPEHLFDRFPTPEHLRKYALIKAGYYDERSIVCASKAEAVRVAAFVRPMDEYAVVVTRGAVVSVYTARSQSYKAMGRKEFQESKDKVLELLAGLIRVTPDELSRNAGKAA